MEQGNYVTQQEVDEALEMIGIDLSAPKQIITEVSGFTPMFDVVVEHYHDETRAAVHGIMWRFCQMPDKVCKASLSKIAEMIGVDISTVSRHAEALVADGYFVDLTPDLHNRPHVYADTGRVVMKSSITAGFAQSKATVAGSKATVAQSRESKVLKKDSKKEKIKEGASATPAEVKLYQEVTKKFPPSPNFEDVVKHIQDVRVRLGRAVIADDLRPFYKAWTSCGWNQFSINWLEYAVRGELPTAMKGNNYANRTPIPAKRNEPTPEQDAISRATAERIKAARAQQAHV